MKSYHTEQELISNEQFQLFKMVKLLQKDRTLFAELAGHLPFFVHESQVSSLEYGFYNVEYYENAFSKESKWLQSEGLAFISSISHQGQYQQILRQIDSFRKNKDAHQVCSYFQLLKIEGRYQWIQTHKAFSSDTTYLTIGHRLGEMGKAGRYLQKVLDNAFVDRPGWQMFQSLSKREKEIMRLLVEGLTSKEIAEKLYISKLTADTHRRNIFQKLNIKTYADLFKIAQAFDLLDLN